MDLALLASGKDVAELHRHLAALGLTVATAERKAARFGLSTQRAVRMFQAAEGLPATGRVAARTLAALRRRSAAAAAVADPEPEVDLRRLERLDRSVSELVSAGGDVGRAVAHALRGRLRERLRGVFRSPSERIDAALARVSVDLGTVRDRPFAELLYDTVLPRLMEDAGLAAELFSEGGAGLAVPDGSLADVLEMDASLREAAPTERLARRARNDALGRIAGLGAAAREAVGDAEPSGDGPELDRLVAAGGLSAEDARALADAAGLARLAGDDAALVRALAERGATDTAALARMRHAEWLELVQSAAPQPSAGRSLARHARLLEAVAEAGNPSVYALSRIADARAGEIERIRLLDRIPDDGEAIFEGARVRPTLDLGADADALRPELEALARFASRFAPLGLRTVLNDTARPADERRATVERRLAALRRAAETIGHAELSQAHFLDIADPVARGHALSLADTDPADRPHVRRALMASQRVHLMTDRHGDAEALQVAGLHSAADIAATGDEERLAARTGLPRDRAAAVFARAASVRARTAHLLAAVEAQTVHPPTLPRVLGETSGGSTPLLNTLRGLPGFDDLFGAQTACRCRHCQSTYSPAAYFVDLMRTVETRISEPNFEDPERTDHPLYLRNRRPDLWTLALSCENTDTPVMYLTLVNEVLGRFLEQAMPVAGDVFAFLATEARSSFRQPFVLPHAELVGYLEFLGVSLPEVSALHDAARTPAPHSVLGLSPAAFETVAEPDPAAVATRFGQQFSPDFNLHDTAVLLRVSGLSRDLLGRVAAAAFVRGGRSFTFRLASPDGLSAFTETLEIDGTAEEARAALDRMHRFVRLMRALDWTPEALDLALATFAEGALDVDGLAALADVRDLMRRLGLSVEEIVALSALLPAATTVPDAPSLRVRLFDGVESLEVRHPALGNLPDDAEISAGFGVLQGALGVDEPDLVAMLIRLVPEAELATGTVDMVRLSALWAAARLGRALGVGAAEMARIEAIVPQLAVRSSPSAMRGALRQGLALRDEARIAEVGFGDMLALVGIDAGDPGLIADTDALLEAARRDVRLTSERVLLPGDLLRVPGMSSEAARIVVGALTQRMPTWLVAAGAGAGEGASTGSTGHLLTDAPGRSPDPDVVRAALARPGAPLEAIPPGDARGDAMVAEVAAVLAARAPARIVEAALVDLLGSGRDLAAALAPLLPDPAEADDGLADWLADGAAPAPAGLRARVAELLRLTRALVGTFGADETVVAAVAARAEPWGIAPGAPWDWTAVSRIGRFVALSGRAGLEPVLAALDAWDGAGFAPGAAGPLARIAGATPTQIAQHLETLVLPDDPFAALGRIAEGVRLAERTGLDPAALVQLTRTDFDGLSSARDLVRGAIRAKFPDEVAWREVARSFDERREALVRDAFVDRLLSRPELGFATSRDVYRFFLLDPEMDGCFLTTRVRNAIAACQLYVQRSLMGIERSVATDLHPAVTVAVSGGRKFRRMWHGWMSPTGCGRPTGRCSRRPSGSCRRTCRSPARICSRPRARRWPRASCRRAMSGASSRITSPGSPRSAACGSSTFCMTERRAATCCSAAPPQSPIAISCAAGTAARAGSPGSPSTSTSAPGPRRWCASAAGSTCSGPMSISRPRPTGSPRVTPLPRRRTG